mmetsp:Transcript_4997/g.9586  ORF Transcript_4997/g.9586 Transcript_4997/m.9586 type:complete len:327 (+) Transcript_4997:49-1029(+)
MQRIILVLAFFASASHGRRVAFNPSGPGASAPIVRPKIATSAARQHAPVMGKSGLLSLLNNKAEQSVASDAVPAKIGRQNVLRRLLSSALLKRSVKVAAKAVGAFAAVLLLMQASAFAMPAGAKLPLAFSPAGVWAGYETALAEKPLLVKSLTSLVGWTLGDVLCQTGVEKVKLTELDMARTFRQALFGFGWHGPSSHYFYGYLDTLMPGATMDKVAAKVFTDQVLWNPIFATIYFSYLNVMQGKTLADLKLKMKQDLLTGVKASWGFWVPAHFVNFRFIPGDQRVLYINTLQILYNIFLSFLGNKKVDDAPAPTPAPAPAPAPAS